MISINFILLYVDPGSTSYLLQVIIAAIVGVAVYFKTIWWKIKSIFTRRNKKDTSFEELTDE
ncbi:MAG TPA: hypothetical protein VFN30_08510 [Chitinophagaceae bacterium]|nr:hypothetical protein [Chitinophagaceae bacterium]